MTDKSTKADKKYKLRYVFEGRIKDIEVIFDSYRTLYELYKQSMKTANVNNNSLAAFENCKETVDNKQKEISTKLHTQAFILLTGNFEAFLNDIFENLIQENFLAIRKASGINYSVSDLQKILEKNEDEKYVSLELANITIRQIQGTKNKNEKINFQNTKRTEEVFREYFGIEIDMDTDHIKRIHKYWQMRHGIVHTNAKVDDRYIHNVEQVGLKSEELGSAISINKKTYDQTKSDFSKLLDHIEDKLIELELSFDGIDIASEKTDDSEGEGIDE